MIDEKEMCQQGERFELMFPRVWGYKRRSDITKGDITEVRA